jgi:hypothetical protein
MNIVEFHCPICRQAMVAPVDAVGSLIACPQCQSLVHVPPPGDSETPDSDSEEADPDSAPQAFACPAEPIEETPSKPTAHHTRPTIQT